MTVVASNFAPQINDLYQTDPWATEALLRHFPVRAGDLWWEPAAGNHMIADVLLAHGARVVTSDIATYERPHDFIFDFNAPKLKPMQALGAAHICTNPPYGKQNRDAVRFAEYALTRCKGTVALLLTAKFDFGNTRLHLFRRNPRFAAKIVLYDRIRWFPGTETDGTEDHAWYVWRPEHPDNRTGTARLIYEGKEPWG